MQVRKKATAEGSNKSHKAETIVTFYQQTLQGWNNSHILLAKVKVIKKHLSEAPLNRARLTYPPKTHRLNKQLKDLTNYLLLNIMELQTTSPRQRRFIAVVTLQHNQWGSRRQMTKGRRIIQKAEKTVSCMNTIIPRGLLHKLFKSALPGENPQCSHLPRENFSFCEDPTV